MVVTITCEEYMQALYNALMDNYKNTSSYLKGREGALRLARDFGYGIPDFPKDQWKDVIIKSYDFLCVRFYKSKPPVTANEWTNEIHESIKKRN